MRSALFGAALIAALAVVVAIAGPASGVSTTAAATPQNVDVSQRQGDEAEETIAVNPTNPQNVVVVSNILEGVDGMFAAVSFDGGKTWARRIIGSGDSLGSACCDPSLSFDRYGNLFLTYLYNVGNVVPVALSTDGGLSFNVIANIAKPPKQTPAGGERRGLFRYVDQPTITSGEGAVWLVFNAGGPIVATGARVSGLGQVGAFIPAEVVPGTNNCTYGDVTIGPGGKVMQVCALTETGQGGGKLFVNVDPDGLGPAGFGDRVLVDDTHIGGFDFIPPQPDRSVDSEAGLAWDRHTGRVYIVYTFENKNESDDTDVYLRHSDDSGATWSDPVRVNDDRTSNSQFLPKLALDPTSGELAIVWYDSRNDLGSRGAGDTDGVPNDDAQFWGAFSTDGTSVTANRQISAGTSYSHGAGFFDYGDYSGLAYYGGIAHPAWADNSNSTGTNPDGALFKLDIYTAAVHVPH